MPEDKIAIIDFGSQYTQLIGRRIREQDVYSEIYPCDTPADKILEGQTKGLIFTGGPSSVYEEDAPKCDPDLFEQDLPILGICYGMQLGCQMLGADVEATSFHEYGRTPVTIHESGRLFYELSEQLNVWMSHGDLVTSLPSEFMKLASTPNTDYAAVKHVRNPFWGVQFHPEVTHTEKGQKIFQNFLFEICQCEATWTTETFLSKTIKHLKDKIGDKEVVCGLSGGVDSSVTASLVHRAVGNQLTCIFVDNGLLRKNEQKDVRNYLQEKLDLQIQFVNAEQRFLNKLEDVTDPEEKRKIIGREFIEVFTENARDLEDVEFLAQGTLYPDVIESIAAHGGPTARIKSHHNVGGLPETLDLDLIEPLRFLFKDEAREIGRKMGLADSLVSRQPFPGPGLAIRITGKITNRRLTILRNADEIVRNRIEEAGYDNRIWQYFAVLIPVQTVGVQGDSRTYEHIIAIRAVKSIDGMTADWARIPFSLLEEISSTILNEVSGVNRVVYDVSSKPPATIEWE